MYFTRIPWKTFKFFFLGDGRTLKYQLQQSENQPQSCESHLTVHKPVSSLCRHDSGGLLCFKDVIWASNWSQTQWYLWCLNYIARWNGALCCFMRVMCDICMRLGKDGGVSWLKGEIDRCRMFRCKALAPQSQDIEGAVCLPVRACTDEPPEEKSNSHLGPCSKTHTHTGCGGHASLGEETVFYHFVYLLALKTSSYGRLL